MTRLLRWLSRAVPSWRRDEWLREWEGELAGHTGPAARRRTVAAGAAAHIAWLWSHEWRLDMLPSDIRFAIRSLVRARGVTLAALATLALGIGATAAMFSVIDAVLLRSFDYPQSGRLVAVWPAFSVSPRAIAERNLVFGHDALFETVGAYSGWGFTLTGGDGAEPVEGARVTPALLRALDVQPLFGRWLADGEGSAGRDRVALIGEGLWRRRFGADPAVVGRDIAINGQPYEIAGVMPARFRFPSNDSEVWLPILVQPEEEGYDANYAIRVARLASGVTVEEADARLRVEAERLQRERPTAAGGRLIERARVVPLRDHFVRDVRQPLLLLFGAVALLLLLACANIANLMLTRAAARDTEMALRSALGADRGRLVRQLLVENLVLAVGGGLAGIAVAYGLVQMLAPMAPADIPNLDRASVDLRALAVAIGAAIGSTLIFGVVPAIRASRTNLRPLLGSRGTGGSASSARVRATFAYAQIAIATLLALGAGLLGRSFVNLTQVQLGFEPARVLALRVAAPSFTYAEPAQVARVFDDILDRASALPAVEAAGLIQLLPLTGGNWDPGVEVEGLSADQQFDGAVNWRTITPDYFRAMGMPVIRGRALDARDQDTSQQVAVVNETFARVVFGGQDPIGRRIRTGFEPAGVWATVVGVVGDVRQHAVDRAPNPELYRPFAQHPVSAMWMLARTAGAPLDAAADVRAVIAGIDRDIAVSEIAPMTSVVDRALGGTRLPMLLASGLSVVALAIGLLGIAGVTAFDVGQRRSEIGIRLALGEPPARVRHTFLRGAARLGAAGVFTGLALLSGASRLLETMLFGVAPADPPTVAAICAVALLAVIAASYLPARAASRIDPIRTLRGE